MNCKLYLKPWNPTRKRLCLSPARYEPQPRQHTEARTTPGFAWTDSFRKTDAFNGLRAVCCRMTASHSSRFRYISNVTTSCLLLKAMRVDDDLRPPNDLEEAWSTPPSGKWSVSRYDNITPLLFIFVDISLTGDNCHNCLKRTPYYSWLLNQKK